MKEKVIAEALRMKELQGRGGMFIDIKALLEPKELKGFVGDEKKQEPDLQLTPNTSTVITIETPCTTSHRYLI
jgi:hypothetical protein